MSNFEARMTNECRNPNVEMVNLQKMAQIGHLGIQFSDLIRHSDFDIRHSTFPNHPAPRPRSKASWSRR
jgi:hypothetical protein